LADRYYRAPGPLPQEATVVVPPGVGLKRVSYLLEYAGAVQKARYFEWAVLWQHGEGKLKAGEYAIPPHSSMADILSLLQSGKVVIHKVTIPEGATAVAVEKILNAAPAMNGTLTAPPTEGSILPETYYYTWGQKRAAMIARMQGEMRKVLAADWASRAPDLPYKTPEEAVVLASMIERETAVPAERGMIAGVFVNRLKRGMKLQSDPTVIYGITGGADLGRALTASDLNSDTAYNTYRIAGLPPAPIANPGKESLAAALNPAETDALYFVANGEGGHAFADTYEAHLANVKRWRALGR
jgi:UPF0755 protein